MSRTRALAALAGLLLAVFAPAADPPSGPLIDRETKPIPGLALPAYLAPMIDPVFGTLVTRITGDPGSPVPGLASREWADVARHAYSKVSAWNADASLLVLHLGEIVTGRELLFLEGATYRPLFARRARGEHRWHSSEPDTLFYLDGDEFGRWHPRDDRREIIQRFPGYSRLRFGPGEGNLSWSGRWLVAAGRDPTGKTVAFAFDIVQRKKFPDLDLDGVRLDWAGISPLGNFVVVNADAFTALEDNTQVYDREGRKVGALWAEYGRPSHYDLTVDENGDEVAVGVSKSPPDNGRVIKRRLRDGAITVLTAGGYASHTSARNVRRPGWAYITYHAHDGQWPPYRDEVVAVKLDGSLAVERLAHLHTFRKDYPTEAHAVPSPDGRRVLWASNWANPDARPISAYVADARALLEPAFVVDVAPVVVPRGGEAMFRLRLATKPPGPRDVSVRRASGNTALHVVGTGVLAFSPENWNAWQTLRVAATGSDAPLNRAALLRCSASGLADLDLFAIETDER